MLRATDKITALYCHLSQEDANEGESFPLGIKRLSCFNTPKATAFPILYFSWMTVTPA